MKSIVLFFAACILASAAPAEMPARIVTVGSAVTETVFALGAGDRVVAVDSSSTYPEATRGLPVVGYQRQLSLEGIAALKPDLVLLSAQAGPSAVVEGLAQTGIRTARVSGGHSLEGVLLRTAEVAAVLGRSAEGEALAARIRNEARAIPVPADDGVRAVFVMALGSGAPMVAGRDTAADAALAAAGARNVAESLTGFQPATPEALAALGPEVIVTTSRTVALNASNPQFLQRLAGPRAVRWIVMDDSYLLGFGPRAARAIGELADQLRSPASARSSQP